MVPTANDLRETKKNSLQVEEESIRVGRSKLLLDFMQQRVGVRTYVSGQTNGHLQQPSGPSNPKGAQISFTPQWESEISYTGCNRRNGPDFGRVFLRSNYTDITQNTYIQS